MFEDGNSYEEIMERCLASNRVSSDVDKREGSVIFNGVAPAADEIALIYTLLDSVYENGFADTAEREYLIQRCKERGITPYPATYAVLKGDFNMEIPIGNRFNLDDLNYVVIEAIGNTTEDKTATYSYQLQCETAGAEGNAHFGELSAIDFVDTDMEGFLTELLIPAEDEEDTEDLRKRYLNSFQDTPFGGNKADYKLKTKAISGVGGVKVTPVWNGGGTVKLTIINSDFDKASTVLVNTVQELIDPAPHGTGVGIAPIGHTVTVVSATEKTINIFTRITFDDGYSWSSLQAQIIEIIEGYLLELRKNWENSDNTIVRVSQIENRILNIEGVLDVQDTLINSVSGNFTLGAEEIPVLGTISNR